MNSIQNNTTLAELVDSSVHISLSFLVVSLLGFVSQLICMVVFIRIRTRSRLFKYLLAYSINNALVCLLVAFQFYYKAYLTTSYWMNLIMAYVVVPTLVICNLNSTLLDIITLIDRLSNFNKLAKKVINKTSPSFSCNVITLGSIFLTVPLGFFVEINQSDQVIWYFKLGPQFYTSLGFFLLFVLIFFGFVLTMLAQIGFNIYLIVCIKKHLRAKIRRAAESGQLRHSNYGSVDIRSTVMIIVLCAVSFIEHLIVLIAVFNLVVFSTRFLQGPAQTAALVYVSLRRFSELFFFMSFNQVFNRECRLLARLTEQSS